MQTTEGENNPPRVNGRHHNPQHYNTPHSDCPFDQIVEKPYPYDPIHNPPPLIGMDLGELRSYKFPPRKPLLAPWLTQRGLAQVYACRGVGKTHFALGVAYAVATGGSFLRWHAPKPRRVLYLDGEMPASDMQQRIDAMIAANPYEDLAFEKNFVLVDPEMQELGMPDIASPQGQALLTPLTKQAELIIVDNISTLCRAGAENKADDWTPVQDWALRMRAEKRSVLFVHHAGKTGTQRGTSKREDVLDTVIALRLPQGYSAEQGAEFEIHFEKSRGLAGNAVAPFRARLGEDDNGLQRWEYEGLAPSTCEKVHQLKAQGMSQADIARTLKVNRSVVSRHLKSNEGSNYHNGNFNDNSSIFDPV